jgi:hypothetical protein
MITEQQAMSNFLHQGKYLDALVLSIDLAQPFQLILSIGSSDTLSSYIIKVFENIEETVGKLIRI